MPSLLDGLAWHCPDCGSNKQRYVTLRCEWCDAPVRSDRGRLHRVVWSTRDATWPMDTDESFVCMACKKHFNGVIKKRKSMVAEALDAD